MISISGRLGSGSCFGVTLLPLVDVRQGLQRNDILVVQTQHVRERSLSLRQITLVLVTSAEHDARRYVVGVELQARREQLECSGNVSNFSVHLCERRKGQ